MNVKIESKKAEPSRLFQGVGVIGGHVTVDAEGKYFMNIEGETFWFRPTKSVRVKLTNHLEAYPDTEVYLKVYPVYSHRRHTLWFTAIKFYATLPTTTQINQFLLAGIWQYIPQFPEQPVMSIYRNSLSPREKIEQVKINHLPVRGFAEEAYYQQKHSPSNPQKRIFYRLQVRLNPQQHTFEYLSLLESSENIPNYIKKKRNKKRKSQVHSLAKEERPRALKDTASHIDERRLRRTRSDAVHERDRLPQSKKPDPIKQVRQMNFSLLQQTAIKLREAGFFEGKVSGRGVTKKALSAKVFDSLNNHPEAVKVVCDSQLSP